MVLIARRLAGLPASGPPPFTFPKEWGSLGREGLVVEFTTDAESWVANFAGGFTNLNLVSLPERWSHAVVIAGGDFWLVDPVTRVAKLVVPAVEAAYEVKAPAGWVLNRQGMAFARVGASGLLWHTGRLSWDGFDQVIVSDGEVRGVAWSPMSGRWHPFRVDLETGTSAGGGYWGADKYAWRLPAKGRR
jgi:hypothetical protein